MYAVGLGLALLSLLVPAAFAAEPLAKGIQDNSFLIEEAYNQEVGHVQHILNLRRQGQQWQFSFSREWPIRSQTHQFLLYIALQHRQRPRPGRRHGQLPLPVANRDRHASRHCAPRIGLVLPSANQIEADGLLEAREKS